MGRLADEDDNNPFENSAHLPDHDSAALYGSDVMPLPENRNSFGGRQLSVGNYRP